mmetsp:Transcript_46371/g.99323  ORF Transcript_46371/g.99323 Transcript_46371/m.99323 type:complete len:293 (+) Transcript_46371:2177-3055(+)
MARAFSAAISASSAFSPARSAVAKVSSAAAVQSLPSSSLLAASRALSASCRATRLLFCSSRSSALAINRGAFSPPSSSTFSVVSPSKREASAEGRSSLAIKALTIPRTASASKRTLLPSGASAAASLASSAASSPRSSWWPRTHNSLKAMSVEASAPLSPRSRTSSRRRVSRVSSPSVLPSGAMLPTTFPAAGVLECGCCCCCCCCCCCRCCSCCRCVTGEEGEEVDGVGVAIAGSSKLRSSRSCSSLSSSMSLSPSCRFQAKFVRLSAGAFVEPLCVGSGFWLLWLLLPSS